MKTPITDAEKFVADVGDWGVMDAVPAEIARRLELDRAALMEALEDLILSPQPDESEGEFGCGTTPRKRAAAALAAARANFPEP